MVVFYNVEKLQVCLEDALRKYYTNNNVVLRTMLMSYLPGYCLHHLLLDMSSNISYNQMSIENFHHTIKMQCVRHHHVFEFKWELNKPFDHHCIIPMKRRNLDLKFHNFSLNDDIDVMIFSDRIRILTPSSIDDCILIQESLKKHCSEKGCSYITLRKDKTVIQHEWKPWNLDGVVIQPLLDQPLLDQPLLEDSGNFIKGVYITKRSIPRYSAVYRRVCSIGTDFLDGHRLSKVEMVDDEDKITDQDIIDMWSEYYNSF
jgi:hypothetical protein